MEDNDNNNNKNEATEDETVEDEPVHEERTRSGRITKPPSRLNLYQHHLMTQGHKETEYSIETAKVIAKTINHFNYMMHSTSNTKKQYAFIETFGLKKGLKHFGKKGYDATFGEVKQLHDRIVFSPVDISKLTQQEKKRAMESLIFLVEKRDGRVKAHWCANGST
jgi:hypothetical protein